MRLSRNPVGCVGLDESVGEGDVSKAGDDSCVQHQVCFIIGVKAAVAADKAVSVIRFIIWFNLLLPERDPAFSSQEE